MNVTCLTLLIPEEESTLLYTSQLQFDSLSVYLVSLDPIFHKRLPDYDVAPVWHCTIESNKMKKSSQIFLLLNTFYNNIADQESVFFKFS